MTKKLSDVLLAANVPMWHLRPEVLLLPNIPKPLHGVAPRVVLGKEWWDQERAKAYASTNYHCIACGVHKTEAQEHKWLEGHEVYSVDHDRKIMTYLETVPLCHYCHSFIHNGRLQTMLDSGEITQQKFDAVMRHGEVVLRRAGLKRKKEWADWRLVVNGKEYPPLYKSFEEWEAAFNSADE